MTERRRPDATAVPLASAGTPADAGRDRRVLVAFVAIALVLRLPGHLNSGLWFDEIWLLVETIRGPFRELLTTFPSDNHHPLYSVFAWLTVRAFGEHPWTLRLPAVLFGAASIGMLWRLALRVAPRDEATLATALLCVSYHHVWFSQNARGYTMLLFWTLAATHYLVRVYDGDGRRAWIGYGICLALATFTHASAVLVGVAHALIGVAVITSSWSARSESAERRWAPLLGVVLAGILSLALHAGMLGDMIHFFSTTNRGAGVVIGGESEWTSLWWTLSAVVESLGVPALLGYGTLALGSGIVLVGAAVWFRRDWRHALLFVLPVVVTVAAAIGSGRSLRPRFLFHFGGFGLLILVAGVFATSDWVSRHVVLGAPDRTTLWLKRFAAALMLLASLAILPRAYLLPKQDFEGALRYVQEARRDGELVTVAGLAALPYRDYYDADFPEVVSAAELDRLLEAYPAVYVLSTIPIFLESASFDLAARLVDSREVARFRGSLGGGDVVVYRFEGGGPTR